MAKSIVGDEGLIPVNSPRTIFVTNRILQGTVLVLVVASPWALGGAEPVFEFLLFLGLLGITALAAGLAVLEGGFRWNHCPLLWGLLALCLLCLVELLPVSTLWLQRLSPATARLYAEMLPAQHETLPVATQTEQPWPPPGTTLSLYPHTTRQGLIRLLAAALFYFLVRNYASSATFLRRVSIFAVANGAFLSVFALLQWLTAERGTVFWTFKALGEPFGPFVCRNHFPFYINICLGLGLGLILDENGYRWHGRQGVGINPGESLFGRNRSLGHKRARVLWISFAIALMISAVSLSLSRGGMLSLATTLFIWLMLYWRRSFRWAALPAIALAVGASLALIWWLGAERVEHRLATVYSGQALQEGRLQLWLRSLTLVHDFPVWGTGLGTFQFVEPMTRRGAMDVDLAYDHAHNDYVEALVEGGVLRFGLSLALILIVYHLGRRALRAEDRHSASGLVLGLLVGLTSIVVHSLGDFGIHIPAITLLGIVLCAQLSALGSAGYCADGKQHGQRSLAAPSSPSLSLFMSLACGLLVIGVVTTVCVSGWKQQAAKSLQGIADRLEGTADKESRQSQLAALEIAARIVPGDALLQAQLGQRHLAFFEDQLRESAAARLNSAAETPRGSIDHANSIALVEEHLLPGLQHLLQARDLCPILPDAQTFLALNVERFQRAEAAELYLSRAKRLLPSDPAAWFVFGQQELAEENSQAAWQSWRHCLQLSDSYLSAILDQASRQLTPPVLLERVLPARPELMLRAALHQYPGTDERPAGPLPVADRQLFLEKGLYLLRDSSRPLSGSDLHTQARLQEELEDYPAALASYRKAIDQNPQQIDWRVELASVLVKQRRTVEAKQELRDILAHQPGHGPARALWIRLSAIDTEPAQR